MKSHSLGKLCALTVGLITFFSCTEHVDTSARYVFREQTILSYLEKYSDVYSEYIDLLNRVPVSLRSGSTVAQLMSARGHYTCFAPTNEAIGHYLEQLVEDGLIEEPTWESFRDSAKLDSIRRVVVHNSIIDCGDDEDAYFTYDFPEEKGEFPRTNLNDRRLSVHHGVSNLDSLYINGECPIDLKNRDIITLNGAIHQVHRVIAPKDITMRYYIQEALDAKREGYQVIFRIIQACGLMDTLSAVRDEVFELKMQRGEIDNLTDMHAAGFSEKGTGWVPEHRKYGFTLFAEPDSYWREQGIDPLAEDLLPKMIQWILDNHQYSRDDVFTTDDKYSNENNLLYQWITYHLLPMRIAADRLVIHHNEYGYSRSTPGKLGIPVCDYFTTMGKRRLLKTYESKESDGVCLNRFPVLDNGRTGTGMEVLPCPENCEGAHIDMKSKLTVVNDILNGCIYQLESPISYNDQTRDGLFKERIRFDAMSMFPEAMSNDIRKKKSIDQRNQYVYIPNTSIYNYFENMWMGDDTYFVYFNAYDYDWCNLNADELKAVGRYEIMFTLPPVPRRGTYELRYVVLANGCRSVTQVYFGTDPNNLPVAGIPMDLNLGASNPITGYEPDIDDQDFNAEVDKRMRNNGFMRGSLSVCENGDKNRCERINKDAQNVRRILVRQTMDPNETYYLKLKNVLDSDKKEFYMDYLEYCPKEVYDNPETPEDIW